MESYTMYSCFVPLLFNSMITRFILVSCTFISYILIDNCSSILLCEYNIIYIYPLYF